MDEKIASKELIENSIIRTQARIAALQTIGGHKLDIKKEYELIEKLNRLLRNSK